MAKLALGGNKKCGPGEICDRKDKKGRKRIQGKFLKKTPTELEVFLRGAFRKNLFFRNNS